MKQHISVETLKNFCNTNYKKAEQIIFKIMSSIDFLPWGHEAETIAEQFNIGDMIEFFYNEGIKITLDNCIPASVKVWQKDKDVK